VKKLDENKELNYKFLHILKLVETVGIM